MTVTLEYAEAHLQDLLAKAGAGEEVVIAGEGSGRVRLVAEPRVTEPVIRPARVGGTMRHTLVLPENWEEEWDRMGEEIAEMMNEGPIFPSFSEKA